MISSKQMWSQAHFTSHVGVDTQTRSLDLGMTDLTRAENLPTCLKQKLYAHCSIIEMFHLVTDLSLKLFN